MDNQQSLPLPENKNGHRRMTSSEQPQSALGAGSGARQPDLIRISVLQDASCAMLGTFLNPSEHRSSLL